MCIFPVRLSLTEATIRQVPQRMTCRSAHLCSCVLPFLTLNTPFSRVRSCWSAFTGRSGGKSPHTVVSVDLQTLTLMHKIPQASCAKQSQLINCKCSAVTQKMKSYRHSHVSMISPIDESASWLSTVIPGTDLTSALQMDTALLSHILYI